MHCNYCNKYFRSKLQTALFTGPEIIIIILNRGKDKQFKVKCKFVSKLNLSDESK